MTTHDPKHPPKTPRLITDIMRPLPRHRPRPYAAPAPTAAKASAPTPRPAAPPVPKRPPTPQLIRSRPSTSVTIKPAGRAEETAPTQQTAPPVAPRPAAPAPPRPSDVRRPRPQRAPAASDGILRPAAPLQPANAPTDQPAPPRAPRKRRSRLRSFLSYTGIVILALAIGFSFYNQSIGQWIVIGAGVLALILRAPSSYLFGSALFTLIMIPVVSVMHREALAQNYAFYTFLLLVFGTVASMFEVKNTPAGTPGRYSLKR